MILSSRPAYYCSFFFVFNDTATTEIYTLSLHDALPISQLDGGHILYAALPRWQQRIALGFWTLIVVLGWYWRGWLVWGLLVLLLSRGRLGHPPVLDAHRPLPPSRRAHAWAAIVLFLITFAPVPFRI